jgi:hypothetical protein
MTPDAHAAFTARLLTRLSEEPDVLGVVTLGSSSGLTPGPDAFSDHDFFVVTRPGVQERFRADLRWLPDAAEVVLQFRETVHGVKALYASGHLAEFAVFDPDELALARVNRYRVLLDRDDVASRLAAVHAATRAATATPPDLHWHAGQFLTELVVAAGRATRGETLSGHQRIRAAALQHLVVLVRAHHPEHARRDDLDATRRFEQALPAIGHALDAALQLPVVAAAQALLALADRELGDLLPAAARDAVAGVLDRMAPAT